MVRGELSSEVIIQHLVNEYYLNSHYMSSIILDLWDILLRIAFLTLVE